MLLPTYRNVPIKISRYRGENYLSFFSLYIILIGNNSFKLSKIKKKIHSPVTSSKMADNSDTTPFLADNDHGDNYDETEHYITKKSPANAHFKLPIKILTIIISVLSFSICGILIGSYVFINTGPFEYTYGSSESVRDLAICVCSIFPLSHIQLPLTQISSIPLAKTYPSSSS
jgi:hypothetical protein